MLFLAPNGKLLASASKDTVRLWDLDPQSWLEQACNIANRNLSHDEWRKYMGERPHEKTCPNLPKDTLGAIELVRKGEELAKKGNLEEAVSKFKQAREWDSNIVGFDPEIKAKQLATPSLVNQGE